MIVDHKPGRQLGALKAPFPRLRDLRDPFSLQVAGKPRAGEIRFIPVAARPLRGQQVADAPLRSRMAGFARRNHGDDGPRRLRGRAWPHAALRRVNVRGAGLAPAAVIVLAGRQPFHRAPDVGLAHIFACRFQGRQRRPQAVDVVDAPPPEPAAVRFLFGAQVAIGGL